jgi:hypothetical protein
MIFVFSNFFLYLLRALSMFSPSFTGIISIFTFNWFFKTECKDKVFSFTQTILCNLFQDFS